MNPSGRLPVTMPNIENEIGFSQLQFPGIGGVLPEAVYQEDLLIGYRSVLRMLFLFIYLIS